MELTGVVELGTESYGTDWCCWLGNESLELTGVFELGTESYGTDWCC